MELKEQCLRVLDSKLRKKIVDDELRWQIVLELEAFANLLIDGFLQSKKDQKEYER